MNEHAKVLLTEQYMLDRIHGETRCRFCRQLLDSVHSCPKCSIFKKPL